MNDVEQWEQRQREDRERETRKALNRLDHPNITVRDSSDPDSGLQPAIGSHDAWAYRHAAPVKPQGFNHGPSGPGRDLSDERRTAEGSAFVPRCTGCLARLDPQWCGHLADDDRDAR